MAEVVPRTAPGLFADGIGTSAPGWADMPGSSSTSRYGLDAARRPAQPRRAARRARPRLLRDAPRRRGVAGSRVARVERSRPAVPCWTARPPSTAGPGSPYAAGARRCWAGGALLARPLPRPSARAGRLPRRACCCCAAAGIGTFRRAGVTGAPASATLHLVAAELATAAAGTGPGESYALERAGRTGRRHLRLRRRVHAATPRRHCTPPQPMHATCTCAADLADESPVCDEAQRAADRWLRLRAGRRPGSSGGFDAPGRRPERGADGAGARPASAVERARRPVCRCSCMRRSRSRWPASCAPPPVSAPTWCCCPRGTGRHHRRARRSSPPCIPHVYADAGPSPAETLGRGAVRQAAVLLGCPGAARAVCDPAARLVRAGHGAAGGRVGRRRRLYEGGGPADRRAGRGRDGAPGLPAGRGAASGSGSASLPGAPAERLVAARRAGLRGGGSAGRSRSEKQHPQRPRSTPGRIRACGRRPRPRAGR